MRKFPLRTTLTCEIIGNDDDAKIGLEMTEQHKNAGDGSFFYLLQKGFFSLEFIRL